MAQGQGLSRTLIVLLTIAVSIYLLEKLGALAAALGNVVLLLALAWLLAFVVQPVVHWFDRGIVPRGVVRWARARAGDAWGDRLERLNLSYGFAVAAVFLLLLAALIFIVLELIPVVIDQIAQIAQSLITITEDLPGAFQRIADWLNEVRQRLIVDFQIDPAAIPLPSPEDLIAEVGRLVAGLGQLALDLVAGFVFFLTQLALAFLIAAYILIDGGKLAQEILQALPDRLAGDLRVLYSTLDRTFGGFVRGMLLQALLYGSVVTASMLLFGLSYALVVGVATGLLMLIPYVGGILGLALPLLAGLLQSSPNTLPLVLVLFIFQMLLFNLIMPRILSQALRVPTLFVFVALIIAAQLMGVWGLLFGVPLAAALYSIALALLRRVKHNAETRAPSEPGLTNG
jgi:predicted PurR-regulated permease PerM